MNKTPLIKELESVLGAQHGGTFAEMGQHTPIADLDRAAALVNAAGGVDTLISVGGGSPIDASKCLSFRYSELHGHPLRHITIPTTGSAAECTTIAAFTNAEGTKTGIPPGPHLGIAAILYDPSYIAYTPKHLFLSTCVRSLDHAIELQYYPTATPLTRSIAAAAARDLFLALPAVAASFPADPDAITRTMLAAFQSLGFIGMNLKGALGLSHVLGYALGSPYGIGHGVTSCIALAPTIAYLADAEPAHAARIAALLDVLPGGGRTGRGDAEDCREVGRRVAKLVDELGLTTSLTAQGVGRDQVGVVVKRALAAMGGLGAESAGEKKETPEETKKREALERMVSGLW